MPRKLLGRPPRRPPGLPARIWITVRRAMPQHAGNAFAVALSVCGGVALVIWLWIRGVLFSEGRCNFVTVIQTTVGGGDATAPPCRAVNFTADLTSIALATTSVVAVATYGLLREAIQQLPVRLARQAHLQLNQSEKLAMEIQSQLRPRSGRAEAVTLILVALAVLVLGLAFRSYVVEHNPAFTGLAPSRPILQERLRENWWAGPQAGWDLRVIWLTVGCIGAFFAIRIVALYAAVSRVATGVLSKLTLPYVSSHLDEQYGLGGLVRILSLFRVCTINFSVTATTVVFVFGGDTSSAWVTAIPLTLAIGGGVNLWANLLAQRFIKDVFARSKEQLLRTGGEVNALTKDIERLSAAARERVQAALLDDASRAGPFPANSRVGQVLGAVASAGSVLALMFTVLRSVL